MIPDSFPKTQTWAVSKTDLEFAWGRYTHYRSPPKPSEEDYLSWCAFQTAYAAGWLDGRGLNPDWNRIEWV